MLPYPAHWEADVVLRDGRTAHLRPVTPDDAERLVDFYAKVSDESKYFRFFAAYPRLSTRDVNHLTTVDYDSRVVLLALVGAEVVGVVQYERVSSTEVEVAFLVQDAHQGRGLGSVLLEHLAEVARERGIGRFRADVLPANQHMLAVFRAAGYQVDSRTSDGVVSLSFDVRPTEASQAVTQEREHRAEARSVARLLAPRSVAVIGVSRSGKGVGASALRNLISAGFTGDIHVIHPEAAEVYGVRAYPRLHDVPGGVELVIVAVPAHGVAALVSDAARAGAAGLVVVSEGFAETGRAEGRAMQGELVRLVRAYGMRLLGPNALGLINPDVEVRLNASLSPLFPPLGTTAFFAQSGALGIALLENVARRGLGLSGFVSAGNRADVSGNDMLQYWEDDPATRAVLLYLESIGNPRKFYRLARRVGRTKAVVAVKSGGATQGVPIGHTVRRGNVPQAAIEALFSQAGVIGVDNIHEMFDVAQLLACQPVPAGPGVAIVANSGALSLLAAAACARHGLEVVGSRVDLGSTATGRDLAATLAAVDADPAVHSVVVAVAPPVDATLAEHAVAVAQAAARGTKTVVATYVGLAALGGEPAQGDVPAYPTPEDAVRALAAVTAYGQWRRRTEVHGPVPTDIDAEAAAALVDEALAGRADGVELDRASVAVLLGLYGIRLDARPSGAADSGLTPTRDRPDEDGTDGDWRRVAVRTREDPLFGPVVSFGLAGIVSDVLGDVGYGIPPLTELDATELVHSIKAAPLLLGHGGRPALDVSALADLLVRVGRLAYDLPHVAVLDLDPVVVAPRGFVVLGATCALRRSAVRVDRAVRSLPDAG